MTDVAFLGTGVMGLPMARNLNNAGFAVHAWNRTPARAEPLRTEGVAVYDDAVEAAAGCPVMVTMLSDGAAVLGVARRVLAGGDGLGEEPVWIQMSTIGVEATERCLEVADEYDVAFVDAPVLGTRDPAEQGQLVVLAASVESARPVADPVFAAVGGRTLWLGEAPAASAAKVVLNSWVLGVVGALSDTIALARSTGVDPAVFFDAVAGGALDLPYARIKGPAMVDESFDDVSFALSLARKDGELVLAAARAAGVELPAMEGTMRRLRRAERDGHGDEDMAAMYLASRPSRPTD